LQRQSGKAVEGRAEEIAVLLDSNKTSVGDHAKRLAEEGLLETPFRLENGLLRLAVIRPTLADVPSPTEVRQRRGLAPPKRIRARGYADGQQSLPFPTPALGVVGGNATVDQAAKRGQTDEEPDPLPGRNGNPFHAGSGTRSSTKEEPDPLPADAPHRESGGPRASSFFSSLLIITKKKESETWTGVRELALAAFDRLNQPPHRLKFDERPEVWIGLVKLAFLERNGFAGQPGWLEEGCDAARKGWKPNWATKIAYLTGVLAKLARMERDDLFQAVDQLTVPESLADPPTRTVAEPRSTAERSPERVTAAKALSARDEVPLLINGRLLVSDVKEGNADAT
jgi:hypothetical protein